MFENLREIIALAREDVDRHAGDIAVRKLDLIGVRPRPALERSLGELEPLGPIDLDALRALPEHTFGWAFADFLDRHGLRPLELTEATPEEVRRRNAYGVRYLGTHDMLHVLLGHGPDWVGEMGVLAFTVGQDYAWTLRLQALTAWLVYPFRSGFRVGALWRAWREGRALGRRVGPVIAAPLEDRFTEPLEQVRRDLGLIG